jgi:hypothetical protein
LFYLTKKSEGREWEQTKGDRQRFDHPHPGFQAENRPDAKIESTMGIAGGWRVE